MMKYFPVRFVSVGIEDVLPQHSLPLERQPRVQALDRVLHLQAGVQDQVHGERVQRLHGGLRLSPPGSSDEPTVPLCSRWPQSRDSHSR